MNNDQNKIEELKKKLYSVADDAGHSHRSRLHPHEDDVATSWTQENDTAPVVPVQKLYTEKKKTSVLGKILIISLLALLAAGGFAWYMFITGGNYISGNNIDIKVIGPVSAPSGETLNLDVSIYNGNPEKLETVDLIVQYPDGTRSSNDGTTELLSERIPIGDVLQGDTARRSLKVILFGEENTKKDIKITAEYKVPGSVILFRKEKVYPLFIGSAPITIDVSNFDEVLPNQSTDFKVVIKSNSQAVVKNLLLKADYPAGFGFEKGTPAPSFGSDVWTLGDIAPGDKREITITGKVVGDSNIERYFGFSVGTEDPTDRSKLAVRIIENKEKILVQKPFLGADFSLDGTGIVSYPVEAGKNIRGEIIWQNNLNIPLYDLILEMKINGVALDRKTIDAGSGFYSSQTNTITWDQGINQEFKELAPREFGTVPFAFSVLPATAENNSTLRRQSVKLELTVRAKRLGQSNVPEEIKSTASKTVKVASAIGLSSRAVRNEGPFENTGPTPLKVGQSTTFTILNSVTNSFNNVRGATYKTTLPPYVTWVGKVYPENAVANVKYNADTRELTWIIGDLAPGTGFNTSVKEFSYQVSINPSLSQEGTNPIIVNQQRLAGTDTFTETVVEGVAPSINTDIYSDPQYRQGIGRVTE